MPRFETNRLYRVLGAVAFLLLAGGIVTSEAHASCGNYVWVQGRSPTVDASMPTHDRQSHQAQSTEGRGKIPVGPGAPTCHGPNCSSDSPAPAAPAPSIKVHFERWACHAPAELRTGIKSVRLIEDASPALAEGFGLSILRPPR